MKIRVAAAIAAIAALVLSTSGADAGTPTMDGKKVKVLNFTANGGTQDHDSDAATALLSSPDRSTCDPSRCVKVKFVYKPAKGAKGGLMITATWGKAALSDYDLYLFELDKRGNGTDVGHCGGAGTASEKVYAPPASLHSGRTYLVVVDFFRSVSDAVTGKIEMGVPSSMKSTVPAKADEAAYPINCTQ
jgi:hypothetical protein